MLRPSQVLRWTPKFSRCEQQNSILQELMLEIMMSVIQPMAGWLQTSFFTWLSSLFYPAVRDTVQFPIVLFIDGHTSHINISVGDFCRKHGIISYCLPAHGSHVLQPLNVSVFGPLKKAWNQSIERYKSEYNIAVTKSRFIQVFNSAWSLQLNLPKVLCLDFEAQD